MRITTWNVNGIRNPFSYPPWNIQRTFPAMFDILESDIVVLQELKIQRKDLKDDMVRIDGWDCYFSLPKHKKGYSGVGIYTRNATCAPIRAEEGLLGLLASPLGTQICDKEGIGGQLSSPQLAALHVDPALLDAEGRCVLVEFPAFVLLGVYSPANSNGLRDDFRHAFMCALDFRIRNLLHAGKRVVLVGDLNVSRSEMDGASAIEDCKKAGLTHQDYMSTPNRRIFNQLLIGGEVWGKRDDGRERGVLWDTSRAFHPTRQGMYTHWEVKVNARPGNFGSRIDYVLISETMASWVKDANIQEGLLGSDHCPVYVDFNDDVECGSSTVKLLDLMSPLGTFNHGVRIKDWALSSVPPLSAKRLPEFANRKSIRSMFAAREASQSISEPPEPGTASVPPSSSGPPRSTAESLELEAASVRPSSSEPSQSTSESLAPGTVLSPSSHSPPKRKLPPTSSSRPSKRVSGQQSLTGFFNKHPTPEIVPNISSTKSTAPNASPPDFDVQPTTVEQAQKSWSALFSRPAAPLCEDHQEPCKTMQTKKKGANQGRSFWMCARPLGPTGDKERGTEWCCPTFIWASDWGRKTEGNEKEDV